MRRQLLLLVAAITMLVLIAFIVPLAVVIRQAAYSEAASAARQEMDPLVAIVGVADRPTLEVAVAQVSASDPGRPVTVFLPDGSIVGSPAARTERVTLAARPRSFSYRTDRGLELLVGVAGVRALGGEGTAVIRTFVPADRLTAGVTRAWFVLAALGLLLLLLALAVADRLCASFLAPVRALADTASRLAAGDLDARTQLRGPPEIREVGAALDRLAARIGALLTAERERIADLSHRIRTPLTALRLDSESLRDPEESARISGAAEAIRRAVDEVVTAARRPPREPGSVRCDAVAVVGVRVSFWQVLAEDQARPMTVELPEAVTPVGLTADDLGAAVDALLANVFAHTGHGTPFSVLVLPCPDGGCRLSVTDSGPGFPDPTLLARGHSGGGSTGLGLDIAGRTAESSGGRLLLSASTTGGAVVTLELGAPGSVPSRAPTGRGAAREPDVGG